MSFNFTPLTEPPETKCWFCKGNVLCQKLVPLGLKQAGETPTNPSHNKDQWVCETVGVQGVPGSSVRLYLNFMVALCLLYKWLALKLPSFRLAQACHEVIDKGSGITQELSFFYNQSAKTLKPLAGEVKKKHWSFHCSGMARGARTSPTVIKGSATNDLVPETTGKPQRPCVNALMVQSLY